MALGALAGTEISSEKATAATLVYRQLRQDILKGELKPGQKLQIDQVAARYQIGANPVREALNRLSSEHLVDRKDQRGFFVPQLSLERLRELVTTRCWLETKALEESILHRTQEWEDNIVLTFHRLSRTKIQRPEDGGDNSEWEVKHRAFHTALIAACGSTWLIGFCNEMMDHAERYRYISMTSSYPRRDSNEEHRLIMEATLDGDIDLAKERLTAQYQLTLHYMEEQIDG
jgi:GntR family carbon starvation induced transcriptional regulator